MKLQELIRDGYLFLDGAMGTELQAAGLKLGERPELLCFTAPETVAAIHRRYIAAGSQVIYANTFQANGHKLEGTGYTPAQVVTRALEVARDAGINVERTRVISMVISTVFAGFGMIIYLQNVGNFPTYTAHTQIGMFAIAALLVGGASVDRASIGNVFLGVILFHTMFIVAPKTGAAITGDSMIGEYFRVFVSYAVITLALVMYESKKRKNKSLAGQQLAAEQAAEEEASK